MNNDQREKGRLVIFGDSYSCEPSENFPPLETTWHFNLSQDLELGYLNYAQSGTNLIWSLHQYWDYIENEYNKADIIIFVLTAPERFWFSNMDHPRDGNIGSDKKNKWRSEHADIIKYLLAFTPNIHFKRLRTFALTSLNASTHLHPKMIVLDGGHDDRHRSLAEKILKKSDNFYYPDWSLGEISKSEFKNSSLWKKVTRREVDRSNHLNKDSHLIVRERLLKFLKND